VHALRADPRLGAWERFVPEILAAGETDGMTYVVERAFGGVPASSLLTDTARRAEVLAEVSSTVAELHRLTSATLAVDDAVLDRWVGVPLEGLRRIGRPWRGIERLGGELREFLAGRSVEVSWVHGDYWPGNVLVDETSASVRGVVDWEWAADGELPAHDVFHVVLFTRSMLERTDLGLLVRDLLRGRSRTGAERDQLEQVVPQGDPQWFRTALLLYWMRHLASHLGQPATGTNRWVWVRRNVIPVLRVA
jgi:aminoglycoside phosphotransferase (APT) family kinase protein